MLHDTPLNLSDLPVYQKALEIFTLSQNISMYLNKDLSDLKADGSEDEILRSELKKFKKLQSSWMLTL